MNNKEMYKDNTSTILPLGRPPPKAQSKVKQPLGKVSLQTFKMKYKICHAI